ncbi:phosphate/phosphite/phosphonate ABC transporter substrate-binding protein [Trichlorobacter lovleyi]|uniref:phosphate/phosphite/phosphonate ABC transporter substrate-binding protein n=1 Tax=Trichlorobacter lovleyi TaxID=313985 RepID=UPI0023F1433A|nr:phosphate/phosphite/phosphonate ABC transporter substrate-binding protein [Trichlorobacter lovleyi]
MTVLPLQRFGLSGSLFAAAVALCTFLLCIPPAAEAAGKPLIRFGVIPRYNPLVMYKRYQPIMDYLTAETPYRFELKISKDYPEAVRFLQQGVTQISSLGDVTFAEANLRYQAMPILKPLNKEGVPFYRSAIIVRNDSALRSITELKGKTMAFGSPHSTSGNLIPRYLLWDNKVRMQDLKSFTNLQHHDAVAKAILKGQFDAGAVKDVVAEKYKPHGLRILAWSKPIPAVPLVVRRDTPPEVVEAITRALLKLDRTTPRHKAIMKNWDDEFNNGFATARQQDYADIFRMIRAIPTGCGIGCHHK